MTEHLLEGSTILAVMLGLTFLSRYLIRWLPALADSRKHNYLENKARLAKPKYPPVLRSNGKAGLATLALIIFVVSPFVSGFESQPWWRYLADALLVILLADLLYYFVHRFLFHSNGFFRRIHGRHHQARNPSHIDAHYAHPLETFIGLQTLIAAIVVVGLCVGGINTIAMGVILFLYVQLNILIHAQVDLEAWPLRWATWLSRKHHAHHVNMNCGNYATLMLFYDRMFGTFE